MTTTTTTPARIIAATATREGKWWTIDLPELGTVTQARKVSEIDHMATDVAALWLDVDPVTITVKVTLNVPEAARATWERAQAIETEARAAETEAATLRRAAVAALRADGYTLDAAARAFDISTQRAHQLAH